MPIIHKIGLTLTVLFAIIGFWDVKGFYDSELFENVFVPILGIVVFCGGMKFLLDRA